jgi:hypothetical protein
MNKSIDERNRENAQRSTGPKTDEGKAKSAQNSRTHGLSATTLHVPDAGKPEFLSLYNALHREVRPSGELQMQCFDRLIHAAWQQTIARSNLAQAQADRDERREALAHRYLRQHERSYDKALREIQRLQADMALRFLDENLPLAVLPESYNTAIIAREINTIARFAERTQRKDTRAALLHQIGTKLAPALYPKLAKPPAAHQQEAAA